jgi:uncharacterized protein (TIGR02246 family)
MKALRSAGLFTVIVLQGCALGPDTRSSDEATIHTLVEEWSAASQAKDPARFTSVYAEDAVVMLEGSPDLQGLEAIRAGISGMMQDPNFALEFHADNIVAARSGDLAYETGTFQMTMSDPDGKPASQTGNYVVVWGKQSDGTWKVLVDAPVSSAP